MSRKTAIRITSAEIAAAEHAADSRRDAAAKSSMPTTLDILRATRDQADNRELLRLADSAARLELRGVNFDTEDRRDCAAEIIWHIFAETDGAPPRRGSRHATLTYMCGLAKNWRRALVRRRAAEARAADAAEDAYALTAAAVYDEIHARPIDDDAAAAEDAHYAAMRSADAAIAHLELTAGGGTWRVFYQWARDETAEVCAEACDVGLSAWKMSTARAGAMIRAAYPDSAELLAAILPATPQTIYRGVRLDWPERTGTDGGSYPERPLDAAEAREASRMRHQCPVPGLADIGRSRARRGYIARTASTRLGYYIVPGRSERQIQADALRTLARAAHEQARTPERVHYIPQPTAA